MGSLESNEMISQLPFGNMTASFNQCVSNNASYAYTNGTIYKNITGGIYKNETFI